MTKARHLVKQLFLLLLIPVLAAVYFAGPSSASAGSRAHFTSTATTKPCGIKHYAPCPSPKNHPNKHHVKQGHSVHVKSTHYPAKRTLKVYIKGHGHNKLAVKITTDKHGNAHYSVKIPANFKPGKYKLIFKAAGYNKPIKPVKITVKAKHKHHHHHH